MTTIQYIPTVERAGFYASQDTLPEALANWHGQITEAIGEPHPVLVRFYVDNGWDKRGWYVSEAQQVNIRFRRSNRCKWGYDIMTFAQSREYRMEVK